LIEIRHASKHYVMGDTTQPVLNDVSLSIAAGEFVAIVGPSGNGKTTLLNLIAGIDRPSDGEVIVNRQTLRDLSEERLSIWRRSNIGIVFQFFQLLPSLSLLQNVMLPMDFAGQIPKRRRRALALELLERVGLAQRAHHLPSRVSGGEQQRAAIARALANDPPLIVADEPTGNLDAQTADDVFDLLRGLTAQGKTLVLVTHNAHLTEAAGRRIEIRSGRIHFDSATVAVTSDIADLSPP
jgi:putative ABC transport system ATP-binding protein